MSVGLNPMPAAGQSLVHATGPPGEALLLYHLASLKCCIDGRDGTAARRAAAAMAAATVAERTPVLHVSDVSSWVIHRRPYPGPFASAPLRTGFL